MSSRLVLASLAAVVLLLACKGDKKPPPAPAKAEHVAQKGDVAIVGATLVPMDKPGTVAGHTVLLRGDRIVAVAPAASVDTAAATVIDGKGQWLVPGLADMHVHLWGQTDLPMFLANGVTTVRNLFGNPQHAEWRDRIRKGELDGPTLITAGPIVDGDPPVWPGSDVVTTPEAARAAVIAQKKAGYDWIKVYNGLSAEVYAAVVAEAKAQHLPVGGHVPKAVGIAAVLASGQRTIEHLDGYIPFEGDPTVTPELIATTAKAEVWNCPTLIVMERLSHLDDLEATAKTRGAEYVSPLILAAWDPKQDFRLKDWTADTYAKLRERNQLRRTLVGDLSKAGARIVLGTDTGNPYVIAGFAVHDELALLVGAGLTTWQALHAATVAAADMLDTPGELGVIAPDARADLILVAGDPLVDLGALREPSIVIVRGVAKPRAELIAAIAPPTQPADRFAGVPAIEAEGTPVAAARYDLAMNDQVIGGEKIAISTVDGKRVIRGQAVFEMPARMVVQYRSSADALTMTGDLPGGTIEVTREGGKVAAKGGAPALDAAADAVIAPQAITEFVWYAERLADVKPGGKATLTAVEVMVEAGLKLEPGTFEFTRQPDADGRKIFGFTGRYGTLEASGTLAIDADGLPHRVSVTVKWGTFVTTRINDVGSP